METSTVRASRASEAANPARLRKSDWVIFAAVATSFALSVSLWFTGDTEAGLFVGLWVPSILAFACYLKLSSGGRHVA